MGSKPPASKAPAKQPSVKQAQNGHTAQPNKQATAGNTTPPAKKSAYASMSSSEKRKLEDTMNAVAAGYQGILLLQRDAVDELYTDSLKVDPPPFALQLLQIVAKTALAAALGPIGAYVGGKIASEIVSKAVESGVQKFLEETVTSAVGAAVKSNAGGRDSKEAFFRGQKETLTKTSTLSIIHFHSQQKEKIRQGAKPQYTADNLLKGVTAGVKSGKPKTIQRFKSLDEWAVYIAKKKFGTRKSGKKSVTNLKSSKCDLDDTSQSGILGVEIYADGQPHNPRIKIKQTQMDGMNSLLRARFNGRKIKDIKTPKVIHGTVTGPTIIPYLRGSGSLEIGTDEKSSYNYNTSSTDGVRWLKQLGAGKTSGSTDVNDKLPSSTKWKGIEKAIKIVGNKKVKKLTS